MKKISVSTVMAIVLPLIAAAAEIGNTLMDNKRTKKLEELRDEIDNKIENE